MLTISYNDFNVMEGSYASDGDEMQQNKNYIIPREIFRRASESSSLVFIPTSNECNLADLLKEIYSCKR
jgi:hypothetical protein